MIKFYQRLSILFLVFCAKMFFAQAYTENFDNVSTLTASGWFQRANSSPLGNNPTWYQGFQQLPLQIQAHLMPIMEQRTLILQQIMQEQLEELVLFLIGY